MKKIKVYRNIYRFISVFVVLSLVSLGIIFLLLQSAKNTYISDINDQAKFDIESFSNLFLEEISQLSTDIFLITDLISVHESLIINEETTEFLSIDDRRLIEAEFLTWLGMKQTYDQIRILDNTGQEIIRANFNSGDSFIVEESQLQNKSSRYYFQESIVLDNRELYMSVLDLNIENGKIEMIDGAPKPMLRVATPIYNKDGVKLGIVIINYLAEELFSKLDSSKTTQNSSIEIINENGYYLYAEDSSIEFGFMYPDLLDETYSKYHDYDLFSNLSDNIKTVEDQGDYFTFIRLSSVELTNASRNAGNEDIRVEFGTKEFIIFTEIDINQNGAFINLRQTYIVILITAIMISLIIARLIDESIHLNKENIKRIKFDSLHDSLTSLPNRKNIYEQIQQLLDNNNNFTLLFIDFDMFKEVNDKFGHDIGDIVLVDGSKRIKNSIRSEDMLGRIGGDEFICLLKNLTDREAVSKICKKIIDSFDEPFKITKTSLQIGVSIGAFICSDSTLSIDEIVCKSDEAMYEVKNSGKNNFIISSK